MPHNLNRFLMAQESSYEKALAEIQSGAKQSHWMWYVFAQTNIKKPICYFNTPKVT